LLQSSNLSFRKIINSGTMPKVKYTAFHILENSSTSIAYSWTQIPRYFFKTSHFSFAMNDLRILLHSLFCSSFITASAIVLYSLTVKTLKDSSLKKF
jgi:predicted membrane protein